MIKLLKKRWPLVIGIVLVLALFTLIPLFGRPLLSDSVNNFDSSQPMPNSHPNFYWMIFRTMTSLGLVLVLMVLTFLGIKWLQRRTSKGMGRLKRLEIIDSLSLGAKKGIFLIKVMERVIVVGVTEGNMSFLTELSEADATLLHNDLRRSKPSGFSSVLASQLDKLSGNSDR